MSLMILPEIIAHNTNWGLRRWNQIKLDWWRESPKLVLVAYDKDCKHGISIHADVGRQGVKLQPQIGAYSSFNVELTKDKLDAKEQT